ncbi:MAG: alpha/beta fold hydrolase [Clostridia bacterium]|nr:alpha/beta fold hydrolase [Clostridia bacterium]
MYEEFNYMLSKIVYDVKQLNNGVLPKINLIGHSRGGITNLMYALDHPDMVASMFSIGTPFFGSDSASTEFGEMFSGGDGLTDIVNRTVFTSYFHRWNDNYTRLYSNINVHALGGYSDTDFVLNEFIKITKQGYQNAIPVDVLECMQVVANELPGVVNGITTILDVIDFLQSYARDDDYTTHEKEAMLQVLADIKYIDVQYYFPNRIVQNLPSSKKVYFLNDVLVDLTSQIGYDVHGAEKYDYRFNVYSKCFRESDYEDKEKKLSSPNSPEVVHNLEARDGDFISYILSHINMAPIGYLYKTTGNTIELVGYNGNNLPAEVTIPSQINGKTVDCISYDLFKGQGDNITKITIPATIQVIGGGAFIGLPNLREVVFANNSALNIIGSEAFSRCYNLVNFEIPRYVHTVEGDAFLCCDKLNLEIDSNNNSFSMTGGVFFNKSGNKLLRYPINKTDSSYTIPATVTELGEYAFSDNDKLQSIRIQGSPHIREYAFCNLTNLQEIHFESTTPPYVEIGAFENTYFSMYVPDGYEEAYYEQLGAYANNVDSTYEVAYQIELICSITGNKVMYAEAYFLCGVTLTHIPSKEHYEMEGVYDLPNGQGNKYVSIEYNTATKKLEAETTAYYWQQHSSGILYINWKRISEDVTCSAVANNSVISNPTVHITSGVESTITAPTISGYTFNYWTIYGTNYTNVSITIDVTLHRSYTTGKITLLGTEHPTQDDYITIYYNKNPEPESCVAKGTLITLADGSQVPVESLTGSERLLVWNLKTGSFDTAPILFIDSEPYKHYDIINLYFSDGTHVKVIDEHAFFDFNLNKYVYLRSDASNYIGHYFNKQVVDENGNLAWARVQLTNVTITNEYTMAYSPVTETHLCLYVNGMLSMPGGIEGLVNTFEVDGDTMQIDQAKYLEDVETYGLFTYEEFYELYPVPKYMFDAVDGANLKVALGKGLITYEELSYLIERYSEFFV